MRPFVLRSLGGKRPCAGIEIDLRPAHLSDFCSPLTGQDQEFHDWRPDGAALLRCMPDLCKLIVRQNSLATSVGPERLETRTWIGRRIASLDAPVEESARIGKRAVGHHRPPLGDIVQQVHDVLAGHLVELLASNFRNNVTAEYAFRLTPALLPVPRISVDEKGDEIFDGISVVLPSRRPFCGRVLSLGDETQDPARFVSRRIGGPRRAVGTDRMAAFRGRPSAGAGTILDDIGFATAGTYAKAKALDLAVPEPDVPAGNRRGGVDEAFGDTGRHGDPCN